MSDKDITKIKKGDVFLRHSVVVVVAVIAAVVRANRNNSYAQYTPKDTDRHLF